MVGAAALPAPPPPWKQAPVHRPLQLVSLLFFNVVLKEIQSSSSHKGPCSPKRLCALVFLFWNDCFVKCSVLIGFHFWGALLTYSGFLLAHRTSLGNYHGINYFSFFDVSLEISLSDTQNVVPCGQQPFADGHDERRRCVEGVNTQNSLSRFKLG